MKKIEAIIALLLCVLVNASAGGLARVPVAAMYSTSPMIVRSATLNAGCGGNIGTAGMYRSSFRTSASAVCGGVTTYDTGCRRGPIRRAASLPPGACPDCPWENIGTEENPIWVCPHCDCDPYDGPCEDCHCNLPVGDELTMMIYAVCMGVYIYKHRQAVIS